MYHGFDVLHPRDLLFCFEGKASSVGAPRGPLSGLWVSHTEGLERLDLLAEREICVPANRVE
jgi:hypothetical protein